jgi:hypothetical protein
MVVKVNMLALDFCFFLKEEVEAHPKMGMME